MLLTRSIVVRDSLQGLCDVIFPDQPVLTVISNECECILLHKASFIHLASDQYKQDIRRSEVPYPSEAEFRTIYQNNERWRQFTKQIYLDALHNVERESPRRSLRRNDTQRPMWISSK